MNAQGVYGTCVQRSPLGNGKVIVIHMVTAIYRSKKLDCYTVNVHISGVLKKINKRYPYFELEVEQT